MTSKHAVHLAKVWNCPSCGSSNTTPYCPRCGERQLHPRDVTLVGLLEQAVEALTHADGRVAQTFRELVAHPGRLTAAYVEGRRKAYLGPIQLFFVANLLFFAVQSLIGPQVFGRPLQSQLGQQMYSRWARELVAQHVQEKQTTIDGYAPEFDRAVELHAKSLIVLMVPPLALVTLLLFQWNRRPAATHLVFALHFYAFVLLVECVTLVTQRAVTAIGADSARVESMGGLVALVASAQYFYAAVGRVYAAAGIGRLAKVVLLLGTFAGSWIGYRLFVFLVTLSST
jgi:hypothetical protein